MASLRAATVGATKPGRCASRNCSRRVIAAACAPIKKPSGACEKYPISTRSNPACSCIRAVSAITSALKGGPDGGMISDDTRGAIHPIISTGILIPLQAGSERRRRFDLDQLAGSRVAIDEAVLNYRRSLPTEQRPPLGPQDS